MKKNISIAAVVIILLLLTLSCSAECEPSINKGNLVDLKFNAPGFFSIYGTYALIDHEYTTDDYSVVAVYSTGYEENVTERADIVGGEYVKVSSTHSLTFCGEVYGGHEFTLKASYGGKEVSKVVYAYRPGDAIGGLKDKDTTYFVGAYLTNYIAGITYITEKGVITRGSYLPSSGLVKVYDKEGNVTQTGTISEIKIKDGDTRIGYRVYKNSEESYIEIEKLIPISSAKRLKPGSPSSPEIGSTINLSTFVSTYMHNAKVIFFDTEKAPSTCFGYLYATNEKGEVNEGFRVDVSVSRKNKTTGETEEVSSGTFETGDVITVNVSYIISDGITLTGKTEKSIY